MWLKTALALTYRCIYRKFNCLFLFKNSFECLSMVLRFFILLYAMSYALFGADTHAYANEEKTNFPYSTNLTGQIGLNTVPSARLSPKGTAQIGIGINDPYIHGFMSFQIAKPLNITLRQTSESSSLLDESRRLYPGLDFKLRLLNESDYLPTIAVGVQSAVGHKRMSGEYIAASKRYKDFDFTAGIGWGRYGSAGHFKNPLETIANHFGSNRLNDGENASTPEDWFTGDDVGLFAGIEYFTPIDGLSIKADWGADRNEAEKAAFGFENAAPWSASLNYKPARFIDMSLGTQGVEKIMARLSLQSHIADWPVGSSDYTPPTLTPRPDIKAENIKHDQDIAHTHLTLSSTNSTPQQIGHAYRELVNKSSGTAQALSITPHNKGLRGPKIDIIRRDFELAVAKSQSSPAEIWRNASISKLDHDDISNFKINQKPQLSFILDNDLSLSEDDTGVIYRTALLANLQSGVARFGGGEIHSGTEVRLNIKDNLHRLQDFRPRSLLPVRSDIDLFTDETFSLDRAYSSYLKTLTQNTHISASAGLLEEMYGGVGGEILYRPFGKTYGIGAEAWQVFKRDPAEKFNLGFTGDSLLTGHVNAFYEFPDNDITASLSAGRYLAEDIGGEFALQKKFMNGTKLSALIRTTDQSDIDVFGSSTHLYSGLSLSVPIGNIPYIPDGSEIRLNSYPIGRNAAQRLGTPQPLYDLTTPLSYRHITQHWNQIVE